MKQTQAERLLEYLQAGNSITRLDAFNALGIVELSARVIDLEHKWHKINRERITVQNRFGEDVRVARYSYQERNELAFDDHGLVEGDACLRNGCKGTIHRYDEPNCSCHISPACSNCVNAVYQCNECEFITDPPE